MGNVTERGIKLPDSVLDKAKTLQTGGLNLRIRVFREFITTPNIRSVTLRKPIIFYYIKDTFKNGNNPHSP